MWGKSFVMIRYFAAAGRNSSGVTFSIGDKTPSQPKITGLKTGRYERRMGTERWLPEGSRYETNKIAAT
jgi:hypothetical protein